MSRNARVRAQRRRLEHRRPIPRGLGVPAGVHCAQAVQHLPRAGRSRPSRSRPLRVHGPVPGHGGRAVGGLRGGGPRPPDGRLQPAQSGRLPQFRGPERPDAAVPEPAPVLLLLPGGLRPRRPLPAGPCQLARAGPGRHGDRPGPLPPPQSRMPGQPHHLLPRRHALRGGERRRIRDRARRHSHMYPVPVLRCRGVRPRGPARRLRGSAQPSRAGDGRGAREVSRHGAVAAARHHPARRRELRLRRHTGKRPDRAAAPAGPPGIGRCTPHQGPEPGRRAGVGAGLSAPAHAFPPADGHGGHRRGWGAGTGIGDRGRDHHSQRGDRRVEGAGPPARMRAILGPPGHAADREAAAPAGRTLRVQSARQRRPAGSDSPRRASRRQRMDDLGL